MTSSPPATDATLEQICRENLAVYRESPARLREDVSQESQVAHDYRGRLVYELLQNSDDALVGVLTRDDRVLFRLTDEALWVANTGRAFSEADVRGLCGLGASSKVLAEGPKRASIGHKGLGFKSVLEVTDAPEAYSDTVSFRLGRAEAMDQVQSLWSHHGRGPVRAVPAMRFPSLIVEHQAAWDELREAGFHSAFRFPFDARVTEAERHALATQLLTLPMTSVLFLKHLEEVAIVVDVGGNRSERQWLLERHKVTQSGLEVCAGLTGSGLYRVDLVSADTDGERYWLAHNGDVAIGEHRDGLNGPAWEGVGVSEVSVAVRDSADPRLARNEQRFHVFLPTQEPSGCSILVNGAFTTDLSRQHVLVPESETSYNAYMIGQAAATFVDTLLPHLLRGEGGAAFVLRVLDREGGQPARAAQEFHRRLADDLADYAFLPSGGGTLSLAQAVLPSPSLGLLGRDFAALLRSDSTIEGRRFPDPEFCVASLARVSAAYGATALTASQTLSALARWVDPARATLREARDGRYRVDPVLDLCVALWESSDASDRQRLQAEASKHPVFPIGENEDGTVNRITLGDETAFFPPGSSASGLSLRRLRFLAHAVCWGTLGRTEQRSVLERQMKAWEALFGIKEFRFEEVMRAAVLPGLTRVGTVDTELRDANRSVEALATICRLAGNTTKPEQPLPLGRLGSDRAFFNLSRLEVPCRTGPGDGPVWAPAHLVYFGRDWVGADSVEDIADAMSEAGAPMDLLYLAPPRDFEGFASAIGVDVAPEGGESDSVVDDGEVDLEADTDEALETTTLDRWRNFFAWLGVSRGLRLVHFHDVNDSATWTSTKGMGLPGGWAFRGVAETWSDYRTALTESLRSDPRWSSTDHYLYRVHALDRLDEIASVSRLANNDVAERLLAHLVRNWASYARHVQAEVALVGIGKSPSSRKQARATSDELVTAGADFWLFRLRSLAFCPTSHGPRRPNQAWRPSAELDRRLRRGARQPEVYLPVLRQPSGAPASLLRACLDELQVRGELTPAAFSAEDARDLCERTARVFAGGINEQALRSELRPIYRQMFELLVGSPAPSDDLLSAAPLAARTPNGIRFLPARDVVYASTSGSRERSGVQGKIPLFVLEAEPGALAPLRNMFRTPLLESALNWSIAQGEPVLEGASLTEFRSGLRDLLPLLLARLGADRAERSAQDRSALSEFVDRVEPVESLTLRCAFRRQDLGQVPQRTFFVHRDPDRGFQGYVVWTGPAWPPIAEDAQTLAMALAETLEVNTVETFLSFINATPNQRHQLLDLAGAAERLTEVMAELADPAGPEVTETPEQTAPGTDPAPTDGLSTVTTTGLLPRPPAGAGKPAAPRVPLHRFQDLLIDGEVIHVVGATPADPANPTDERPAGGGTSPGSSPRAAAGTDLQELDRLGMQISIAFERRRLDGRKVVVLPGDEPPFETEDLIVDVSSPAKIIAASEQSLTLQTVLERLRRKGVSPVHPGFDILTIKGGEVDRMIELKSSGVDAQVQAMSWNEWKSAQGPLRHRFWLYLVGNLRADLLNVEPFLRAVHDPFGTLAASETEDVIRSRTVQLRVREFPAADQLSLGVRASHLRGST